MREIVFDTETTGFDPVEHRIVEIGAVELLNRLPTGRTLQFYLNPDREIDWSATKVHGITNEKVKDSPRFADILPQLVDFFGPDTLIAHNASFDMGFLHMECAKAGVPALTNPIIDTVALAKEKLPQQGRYNLDALCRYFNIDLTARTYHGALLDAQLLADVYVELHGGLQATLTLESTTATSAQTTAISTVTSTLVISPTPAEVSAHTTFLQKAVPTHRWPTNAEPDSTP